MIKNCVLSLMNQFKHLEMSAASSEAISLHLNLPGNWCWRLSWWVPPMCHTLRDGNGSFDFVLQRSLQRSSVIAWLCQWCLRSALLGRAPLILRTKQLQKACELSCQSHLWLHNNFRLLEFSTTPTCFLTLNLLTSNGLSSLGIVGGLGLKLYPFYPISRTGLVPELVSIYAPYSLSHRPYKVSHSIGLVRTGHRRTPSHSPVDVDLQRYHIVWIDECHIFSLTEALRLRWKWEWMQ